LPFAPRLLSPGNYYIYDNPSALKPYLQNAFKGGLTEAKFSLLYSVYSFPNVILPFVGGYLVDRYGAYNSTILFAVFVLLGQTIVSLGMSIESYNMMLLGRVLYGMGGETITVSQGAIIAEWFGGGELAFAIAANLAVTRAASSINNVLSVFWAQKAGIAFAFWFGTILCGVALAMAFLVKIVDAKANTLLHTGSKLDWEEQFEEDTQKIEEALRLSGDVYSEKAGGEEDGETIQIGDGPTKKDESYASEDGGLGGAPPPSTLDKVKTFPLVFWLVVISCVSIYGVVVPFNNTAR
jgi:MFS family permease